jgi:hypothetical protein
MAVDDDQIQAESLPVLSFHAANGLDASGGTLAAAG